MPTTVKDAVAVWVIVSALFLITTTVINWLLFTWLLPNEERAFALLLFLNIGVCIGYGIARITDAIKASRLTLTPPMP